MLGLVAIVLQHQGILSEAFYWTLASHGIPHVFWERGVLLTLAFIGACLPLIVGTVVAVRDKPALWADKRAERTALFGLVVASMIGTAAGARFYPHYYIQLVPPLALLAAPYSASEDFGSFGTEWGVPSVFWYVGGTDAELYGAAERAGRVAQDIPTNHNPRFAPVIHPTLETGVQAMVTAALDALG